MRAGQKKASSRAQMGVVLSISPHHFCVSRDCGRWEQKTGDPDEGWATRRGHRENLHMGSQLLESEAASLAGRMEQPTSLLVCVGVVPESVSVLCTIVGANKF